MKKVFLLLLSLFMIMGAPYAIGQSAHDEVDPSNREFQEWAKTLSEFVKDVRFNEKDMQGFINLWSDSVLSVITRILVMRKSMLILTVF